MNCVHKSIDLRTLKNTKFYCSKKYIKDFTNIQKITLAFSNKRGIIKTRGDDVVKDGSICKSFNKRAKFR